MVDGQPPSDRVKIAAMVVLGVVVLAAIVGLTLASLFTDRDLRYAEKLTAGGVLLIGLLGGLVMWRRNGRRD